MRDDHWVRDALAKLPTKHGQLWTTVHLFTVLDKINCLFGIHLDIVGRADPNSISQYPKLFFDFTAFYILFDKKVALNCIMHLFYKLYR